MYFPKFLTIISSVSLHVVLNAECIYHKFAAVVAFSEYYYFYYYIFV